jgi:uncharacterized glyoxalase superfamily protein PhnB
MSLQLELIGLVVADMGKSLAFYRRLGVAIPAGAESQPHVHTELPGGMLLAWDTVETIRSFDPGWTRPAGSAPVSLAFHCAGTAGVDAMYDELVTAGYDGHKPPWDAFWGQRYAIVRDPDGNDVALFAPLENSSAE